MNVYIITLAYGCVSKQLIPYQVKAQNDLNDTLASCNYFGISPNIFPAVDGYSITHQTWEQYKLNPLKTSTKKIDAFGNLPGAHGCFLSHFSLWEICVTADKPMVILEDDAQVIAPLNINSDKDVVKLQKPNLLEYTKSTGHWSAGAYGYWLTPSGAKKMIEFCITNGPKHADKIIGSRVVDWEFYPTPLVKLGGRKESSTNPIKYPLKSVSHI